MKQHKYAFNHTFHSSNGTFQYISKKIALKNLDRLKGIIQEKINRQVEEFLKGECTQDVKESWINRYEKEITEIDRAMDIVKGGDMERIASNQYARGDYNIWVFIGREVIQTKRIGD